MEHILIFGHKNPDTDSVTSAIALSNLKNTLGLDTEPRVLGELNDETKFVLKHFKVEEPAYLNAVKLQIKDIDYHKDFYSSATEKFKKLKNGGYNRHVYYGCT